VDQSVNAPESGTRYSMSQTLMDFTGDGRADFVVKLNNKLSLAANYAGPTGTSTQFFGPIALVPSTDPSGPQGSLASQTSVDARYQYAPAANRNTTDVWRQEIDVNGDGRVDIIDAAEEPDHWVIYLNTKNGLGVSWLRRSISVKALREALTSDGHKLNGPYVPLSRRATGTDIETPVCWRWDQSNKKWIWYPDGFSNFQCVGPQGQRLTANDVLQRSAEKTYVEWQLLDVNGDGYLILSSMKVRSIFNYCARFPTIRRPTRNGTAPHPQIGRTERFLAGLNGCDSDRTQTTL
jgi:hypothetical protein